MVRLRGEEVWPAACVEVERPGVEARQHGDNPQAAMHDLDFVRDGEIVGACEVTAAADGGSIQLWNVANGREERHIEPGLQGGWWLALKPTCRWNRLMSGFRELLEDLEARKITDSGRSSTLPDVQERLDVLGIDHKMQSETKYPGSVYFTIDRPSVMSAGVVPETGGSLCSWLKDWIADPARERKIAKLLKSLAAEKRLFVFLPGSSEAPLVAADVLMRDGGPLPTRPPRLPDGLTHLWVMSAWSSGNLFAWGSTDGWSRHEKITIVPRRLAAA